MYTVDYDDIRPYRNAGRPLVDLYCHGVSGAVPNPLHLIARLDTGADYLVLPVRVATGLGIDLTKYPRVKVGTAGGPAWAYDVSPFWIDIEGQLVGVRAYFMNSPLAVVGFEAMLSAMKVGFDLRAWLFKV